MGAAGVRPAAGSLLCDVSGVRPDQRQCTACFAASPVEAHARPAGAESEPDACAPATRTNPFRCGVWVRIIGSSTTTRAEMEPRIHVACRSTLISGGDACPRRKSVVAAEPGPQVVRAVPVRAVGDSIGSGGRRNAMWAMPQAGAGAVLQIIAPPPPLLPGPRRHGSACMPPARGVATPRAAMTGRA
jgi:hypothetical protein